MAASKIVYDDKVGINPRNVHINQVWDDDMNNIKLVVNDNADLFDALEVEVDANTLDILELQSGSAQIDNVVTKTIDYTAVTNDYVLVNATSGDVTITLPTAIGNSGKKINITKIDNSTNKVIINTSLSQTILGELVQYITYKYDNYTLISDGANWLIK